ncbi:ATP-dependent nuclease [Leptospira bandrabouensis]|uniref:ATP-dependent nuclease n=1 Tax=Leptospira bandrabouensis TaxID=2484903 RepID=UPI001EEB3A81|nr:AAA family ATPase [Leptospira bandrabouensis]MCG6146621.1 AAA family ATPase [Leptospira bandrabouensis]MCG6154093.1 AAA family ATPase [Leptospira bandrabouensis]MCG6166192.1 AAA family ATPase [Leptospira bandrabouensis]
MRLNKSGEPQWNFIGRAGNLNIKQELIDKIVDVVLNSVRFKYIPIGRDILHTIQREISEELVRTIFSGWSGNSVKYRQKINTSLSNLIDDLKPQLSASSQSITNSLQQVFSEIKELELKLPFDSVESMLTFLIPDLTDHYKTSLDSKGAGIQTSSLLFFLKYLADNHPQRHNAVTTFIWAIEEPESFLHPLKQRGVSQILKEFSREVQTFISTHSGNFVNQEQETQLLVVEKDSSAPYSTIIKSNKYDDARESLGVSLIDSMFLKKTNIILEGPSDEILFQGSLLKLHEGKKINLNPEDVKFFTGNNCNSACLLFEAYYPLTKTGEVRNILIIDGDDAGKKALNGLQNRMKNNGINLKANHDYFILPAFTESLISENLKQKIITERPSQINYSENTNKDIIHFELREGGKIKAATRIIELSKIEDLDEFRKIIEMIQ